MLSIVTHVTVFVADHDNALAFYVDTLDFERRADNPNVPMDLGLANKACS